MPQFITASGGGTGYASPFVGKFRTVHVKLDLSGMTTAEVDADGVLKPGVPLTSAGILVGAGAAFVYGVTVEAAKVAPDNANLGTDADVLVAVGIGTVNRDIAEDNLGRAYTADEIAGFDRAGSKCTLTTT